MRHEHLVVTVEAGLKERIDDDLDAGESLESWVADAIERKLEQNETEEPDRRRAGGDGSPTETDEPRSGHAERFGTRTDDHPGGPASGSDEGRDSGGDGDAFEQARDDGVGSDGDDEYDEGFEFVDDCSI